MVCPLTAEPTTLAQSFKWGRSFGRFCPVNLKKRQFLAPWDMKVVVAKAENCCNRRILVTERGFSFSYNNLVSDMRSLVVIRIMDARPERLSLGIPVYADSASDHDYVVRREAHSTNSRPASTRQIRTVC
jgi:hypothetical protein